MLKLAQFQPHVSGRGAGEGGWGGGVKGGQERDCSSALDEFGVTREEVLVLLWRLLASTGEAFLYFVFMFIVVVVVVMIIIVIVLVIMVYLMHDIVYLMIIIVKKNIQNAGEARWEVMIYLMHDLELLRERPADARGTHSLSLSLSHSLALSLALSLSLSLSLSRSLSHILLISFQVVFKVFK